MATEGTVRILQTTQTPLTITAEAVADITMMIMMAEAVVVPLIVGLSMPPIVP